MPSRIETRVTGLDWLQSPLARGCGQYSSISIPICEICVPFRVRTLLEPQLAVPRHQGYSSPDPNFQRRSSLRKPICLLFALVLVACSLPGLPPATSTPTPRAPSSDKALGSIPTATSRAARESLPANTLTPTNTRTRIPTAEPSRTNTASKRLEVIPTDTSRPTREPVPTYTSQPTPQPLPTDTPQSLAKTVRTDTPRPRSETLPKVTSLPTRTPVPTHTALPTRTLRPTHTSRPTNTPYATPTPTPLPSPTRPPTVQRPPNFSGLTKDFGLAVDCGGVIVIVTGFAAGTREYAKELVPAKYRLLFNLAVDRKDITLGWITVAVENHTDDVARVYPDTGTLVVGPEQVRLGEYVELTGEIGGDIPSKIRREGSVAFGLEQVPVTGIESALYVVSAALDADGNSVCGGDYVFELDLRDAAIQQ